MAAGEPVDSDEDALSDIDGPDEDGDTEPSDHNCTIS